MKKYTDRQEKILDLIRYKRMSVLEIAKALGVSEMTVRRDVQELKKNDAVTQFRGGVVIRTGVSFRSFDVRTDADKEEKILLAQKAVEYIEDGMMIFIDNSSTCCYIVPFLEPFKNLKIVTNSSIVMARLGAMEMDVKMAGGNYFHREKCVLGSETEDYIKRYRYDIAFMSASKYDEKRISSWSEAQVHIRRTVIDCAERSVFLMTGIKYGKRSKFVICSRDDVEILTVEGKND